MYRIAKGGDRFDTFGASRFQEKQPFIEYHPWIGDNQQMVKLLLVWHEDITKQVMEKRPFNIVFQDCAFIA